MADLGHKETDERLNHLERRIMREYQHASKEVLKKTNEFMSQFQKDDDKMRALLNEGKITDSQYKTWRIENILTGRRWNKMRATLVDDWFNADKIARRMVNDEKVDVYALNHNYAAYQIEHDIRMSTSFTLYNHESVERLLKDNPQMLPPPGKKVAKDIAEGRAKRWSDRKLQSIMTQSILQGDSIPNIAKRLTQEMGEMSKNAAIRNARTMTTGAEAAGRVDAYKQAKDMGIDMKQMWLAALDGRTRHEHRLLDGQKVEVDKPFKVDGVEIRFPGDPTAPGYLIYNCRCTVIGVVKGSDLDLEGIEGMERDNRLGNMSYDEWKEEKARKEKEPEFKVVNGKDISDTWERRPDKFDFEIEDIINAQGFDGNPRVVDADEFDRAVQESEFIAQRSYSAPDQETLDAYREQLYNGDWYVDCGTGGAQYGQGMYCAADYTGNLTDGIKNEMEHYRDLGESRYGNAQREYAEKVYQEEMDKVNFPLDDRYKNAFTDEMGITDMWTRGSEERQFIKDWISKNPAEANKLKEAYEKAQEIGAQKGMEIESLTREQFKEKYPNVGARSYTETLTLAPDAKIVTWREINDIRMGNLDMDYRTKEIERIVASQGFTQDEATFVKYNLGTGVSWEEVDAAARRLTPGRRNELVDEFYQIGEEATKRYNEEHDRRVERARIYQEKYHDIGSLAAALGYDAINAEEHGQSGSYTVILNRTKVIFRRP